MINLCLILHLESWIVKFVGTWKLLLVDESEIEVCWGWGFGVFWSLNFGLFGVSLVNYNGLLAFVLFGCVGSLDSCVLDGSECCPPGV